jgi:hypothetical protein
MKFTLDLDMPATVTQLEEFCKQIRRVHEAHPCSNDGENIDDALVHVMPIAHGTKRRDVDADFEESDVPLTCEIEREI